MTKSSPRPRRGQVDKPSEVATHYSHPRATEATATRVLPRTRFESDPDLVPNRGPRDLVTAIPKPESTKNSRSTARSQGSSQSEMSQAMRAIGGPSKHPSRGNAVSKGKNRRQAGPPPASSRLSRAAHRLGIRMAVIMLVGVLGFIVSFAMSAERSKAQANQNQPSQIFIDPDQAASKRQQKLHSLTSQVSAEDPEAVTKRAEALKASSANVLTSAQRGMITKYLAKMSRYQGQRKNTLDLTGVDTMGVADILGTTPKAPIAVGAPMKPGTYTLGAGFHAFGSWGSLAHSGQDFSASLGSPVYAVADGVVGGNIDDWWPGNHVVLHFADGSSVLYGHLSKTEVKPGMIVHKGDLVGNVGNTGRSFGAHLHFDYYPAGVVPGSLTKTADPAAWFKAKKVSI